MPRVSQNPHFQLSDEEVAKIDALARKVGDGQAAKTLLIGTSTIHRALCRRPLIGSLVACIRTRLRELDAASRATQTSHQLRELAAASIRTSGLPDAAARLGVEPAQLLDAAIGAALSTEVAARLERALLGKGGS